jgi:hypothetical protein
VARRVRAVTRCKGLLLNIKPMWVGKTMCEAPGEKIATEELVGWWRVLYTTTTAAGGDGGS